MQLSDEVVEKFRALYEQEFGEVISKDDARIRGQEIVALYEKLYELESKDDHEVQQEGKDIRGTSA